MVQIAGGDKAGQATCWRVCTNSGGQVLDLASASLARGWLSIPIMIRGSSSARPILWPTST
jgi:hypothetical protein